jgi:hypothetical protein
MTKLTVAMRDAIVNKAVEKAGLNKEAIALAERRKVWAEKVADESVGGAEAVAKLNEANKKIARIVAGLPKGLQEDLRTGPLTGSIVAAFGGRRVYVNHWDGERPARGASCCPRTTRSPSSSRHWGQSKPTSTTAETN